MQARLAGRLPGRVFGPLRHREAREAEGLRSGARRVYTGPVPDAESAAVAAAVDRFCREAVEPRRARPEQPLAPAELERIEADARALGLLAGDEPGLGLWEDDGAEGVRRTLTALARVGRSGAGAAFHLHRVSLVGRLARRLGLAAPRRPALCLSGMGAIRAGLVRALGVAPGGEEAALLREALPRSGGGGPAFPVHAAPGWEELWAAGWDEGGGVCLLRRPRAALQVAPAGPQHGLDEIPASEVRLEGEEPGEVVAGGAGARALLAEAFGLEVLGLLATALGGARRALEIARDHAAARRQGGAPIQEHGAVQQLLGEASSAAHAVSLALDGAGAAPRSLADLLPLLGLRAAAHPLLQAAANCAMQVLGGTGYMRDAGVERIVRDQNHLALLSGSPRELWLALALAEAAA